MEFQDNYLYKRPIINHFDFFVNKVYEPFYLKVIREINSPNKIQKNAIVLLSKTVNTLKAIVNLIKEGNIVSARVLARSLFEIKLIGRKLILEPEKFLKYSSANDLFTRLFAVRQLKENKYLPIANFVDHNKQEQDILDEIKSLGFTPTYDGTKDMNNGKRHVNKYFEIKEMAQTCGGMELEMYNTMYKNLCQDTHTSSNHFHRYFVQGESEEMIFDFHPYLYEVPLLISVIMNFINDSVGDFCNILYINPKNELTYNLRVFYGYCFATLPLLMRQGELKMQGFLNPL